jgi:hypothetical protein
MRILPFVLGSLLFQVSVHADTFWLSDPKQQQDAAEGSAPDVVKGVLIAESDEGYHVRIVGGEVILPKASVWKIEKDDLSIDAIVKMERDRADALAAANREREMAQAAARRARQLAAVEASIGRVEAAQAAEATPPAEAPAEAAPASDVEFDPVLGVARDPGRMSQAELLRELQLAWSLTQDRRYLKLLRQMRRLR